MARIILDVHAIGACADVTHVGGDETQVGAVVVAARVMGRIHQDRMVHVHTWTEQCLEML